MKDKEKYIKYTKQEERKGELKKKIEKERNERAAEENQERKNHKKLI